MIDWPAVVSIVTIVVGGIVTLGTLYIRSRLGELEKIVKDQTATIASLHAIILGQHDPLLAIEGALTSLRAKKHLPEFEAEAKKASEERFPHVAEEPYSALPPYRQVK